MIERHRRMALGVGLLALVLLGPSCRPGEGVGPKSLPRITVWDLLRPGQGEEPGFGLYSYLLIHSEPADADARARYLGVIEGLLKQATGVPERELTHPRSRYNLTYLPVKLSDTAPLRGSLGDPKALAKLVLEHYDYGRARDLLAQVPGNSLRGPYLVSTLTPLSRSEGPLTRYLWQDLSSIEPVLAHEWVTLFIRQAAKPQFWDPESGRKFALNLRELIVKTGRVTEPIKEQIDSWLKWFGL